MYSRLQGFKSWAGDLKRGFTGQISCHPITECSFPQHQRVAVMDRCSHNQISAAPSLLRWHRDQLQMLLPFKKNLFSNHVRLFRWKQRSCLAASVRTLIIHHNLHITLTWKMCSEGFFNFQETVWAFSFSTAILNRFPISLTHLPSSKLKPTKQAP